MVLVNFGTMLSNTFKLILVRHGETEFNKLRIMQGQMNVPLNDLGKSQAVAAGKHLSDTEFFCVYSSDLDRALETCKLVLSENNFLRNEKVKPEIKLDKRLRERTFGCMEGRPVVDLLNAARDSHLSVAEFTAEGGETLQDLKDRAKDFFICLCKEMSIVFSNGNEEKDKVVLLVSHGGLIKALFSMWLETFTFAQTDYPIKNAIVSNASRSCVKVTLPNFKDFDSSLELLKSISLNCVYFNLSV